MPKHWSRVFVYKHDLYEFFLKKKVYFCFRGENDTRFWFDRNKVCRLSFFKTCRHKIIGCIIQILVNRFPHVGLIYHKVSFGKLDKNLFIVILLTTDFLSRVLSVYQNIKYCSNDLFSCCNLISSRLCLSSSLTGKKKKKGQQNKIYKIFSFILKILFQQMKCFCVWKNLNGVDFFFVGI